MTGVVSGVTSGAVPGVTVAAVRDGAADLPVLPLLTHRGRQLAHAREVVTGVDGTPVASLSLAPDLLVAQTLAAQRKALPLPPEERAERLADAARRFVDETFGGLTFAEHSARVAAVSGHNRALIETLGLAVARSIADAPTRADQGRPTGSARSWRVAAAGSGQGVWTRRGETLGAILSGNLPTIQNGWLQALALGYRVVVRPSRREPFTAYRVIEALRAAGFRDLDAAFLPTSRQGVSTIVRRAHLGLMYGGDDVQSEYGSSPDIKVGGPGRSKTLVGRDHAGPAAVELVADSVTALSGAACVNTTAVLVEGDHAAFARDLAAVLADRTRGRQTGDEHVGPRFPVDSARALVDHLRHAAARAHAVIPWDDVATPHPDGGVVLGPAVFTVADPRDGLLGKELPFPCVWVAPWQRSDGAEPLRNSLVVNAITDDDELVEALLRDPTVQNVHVGAPTVHSDGNLPHEGYLGDFLMRSKAVVST
ncbi:aldehyde dehydrogenase family protein [Actinosynnema sp. NPDC023587]|uniref:aldehyde dehydrogenase family protein n=1 Tax=Actinosynnema sp. NPDC023587 TaxID=3154695 RepID=UPI0033E34092